MNRWIGIGIFTAILCIYFIFNATVLVWLGGVACIFLVLSIGYEKFIFSLLSRWKKSRALKKAAELDWKVIGSFQEKGSSQRDCERPESRGICTGLECYEYERCNFNIKKPLPK